MFNYKNYFKYTKYKQSYKKNISPILNIDNVDYYSGETTYHLNRKVENLINLNETLIDILISKGILNIEDISELQCDGVEKIKYLDDIEIIQE